MGRGFARRAGTLFGALLCAVIAATAVAGGASGQPETEAGEANAGQAKRTGDPAVGASIVHSKEWVVEREEHTFDGAYGFTLWEADPSDEDHGGEPAVRVARAPGLKPGQIEARVRERIASYPDLRLRRETVAVGDKRVRGVAVGPIPGSTPSVEVYAAVEGRVYQINVYGEVLDAEARRLLAGIRFERPTKSASGKLDGKKAETHQREDREGLAKREKAAKEAASWATAVEPPEEAGEDTTDLSAAPFASGGESFGDGGLRTLEATGLGEAAGGATTDLAAPPYYNEYQTSGGCWVPTSSHYFQTQHGSLANQRWGASWTGWTIAGRPNYWGQYTHGDLGYGRCASATYTNDMYAVDYPLGTGDVVFSPFSGGTVMFAGRNYSHATYGIFVVIKADNGKYVSMSAHLDALAPGITKGARVTSSSIIGYAGNTGHPSMPVGESHLHQVFYRYPSFATDGAPYGGAGLMAVYHRYTGTAARKAGYTVDPNPYYNVYMFGWTASSTVKAKGSAISD